MKNKSKTLKITLSLDRVNSTDMALSGDEVDLASCTVPAAEGPSKKARRSGRHRANGANVGLLSHSQPQPRSQSKEFAGDQPSVPHTTHDVPSFESSDVQELKTEIDNLKATVRSLTVQVNFLLSFVGVTEDTPSSQFPHQLVTTADSVESTSSSPAVGSAPGTQGCETDTGSSGRGDDLVTSTSAPGLSYAGVARQLPAKPVKVLHQASNVREAALTAVYFDKADSERRAFSFIVSGLQESNTVRDHDLVTRLCITEFGLCPEISYTKRLGKKIQNKVQPLLVYLKQVDQAKLILSSARQLRESHEAYTKQNVYINENLTKAAARVAYELRCRRRENVSRYLARRQTVGLRQQQSVDAQQNRVLIDSQITDEHDNQQLTVLDPAAVPFVSQQSSV